MVINGFLASVSLLAHHSLAGVCDMDKESELTGSVDSIKFVNPHGSLTILVNKEDGTSVKWTFTSARRHAWHREA